MPTITLYHGTAHAFDLFDGRFTSRGVDPNSGLGIHLTEQPSVAADYAEIATKDAGAGQPVVLVVEAEITKMVLTSDATEFLGYEPGFFDPDTNISREDFVAARHTLQSEGFDGVAVDECSQADVSGTWVIFDPDRLRIVGRLTLEEAVEAEPADAFGIDFEERAIFPDGPSPISEK